MVQTAQIIQLHSREAVSPEEDHRLVANMSDGYTSLANSMLELLSRVDMTKTQFQVVLIVLRKTLGFRRTTRYMTAKYIAESMEGSPDLKYLEKAIRELKKRNILREDEGEIGLNNVLSEWVLTPIKRAVSKHQPNQSQLALDVEQADSDRSSVECKNTPEGVQKHSLAEGEKTLHEGCKNTPERVQKHSNQGEKTLPNKETIKETPKEINKKISKKAQLEQRFNRFYAEYPVKKSKAAALRAFEKLNPSDQQVDLMITALKNQMANRSQLQSVGAWCPEWKHPSTWITQECWEDDLTPVPAPRAHRPTHTPSFDTTDYSIGTEGFEHV